MVPKLGTGGGVFSLAWWREKGQLQLETWGKPLSYSEVEFWKRRFDEAEDIPIAEIERKYHLERGSFGSAQKKLRHNLSLKAISDLEHELLELAKRCVLRDEAANSATGTLLNQLQSNSDPQLIEILVRARAHQVNWSLQKARYRRKLGLE